METERVHSDARDEMWMEVDQRLSLGRLVWVYGWCEGRDVRSTVTFASLLNEELREVYKQVWKEVVMNGCV